MFLLASALAFLIAIGCLFGAARAVMTQRRKRTDSVSTSGVVVDLQKRVFKPGSGGVYCPTVEFRTVTGAVVRFESSYGTMPASHKVGQTVKVLYNPQEPQAAQIESRMADWLAPGCFLAFAAIGFVFGLMFLAVQLFVSLMGS